ncbi:MAG: hypothetical protein RR818_02385 [Citrobacter sp.]
MTQQAQAEALRLKRYLDRLSKARGMDKEQIHCFDGGTPSEAVLMASDIRAVLARVQELEAQQAAPLFYAAFGSSGAALPQYSASTEEGVIFNVLSVARNEGFKGSGLDRLIELGWVVRPVFRSPTPPAQDRKPLDTRPVVSDDELEKAFAGTNFGGADHRNELHVAVLKKASGYHCGHTITTIMRELRLIGASNLPTKKGRKLISLAYHSLMVGGP